MPAPPVVQPNRRVRLDGGPTTLWALELRALHVNKAMYKIIHRTLDALIRRRMAVNEYTLTSLASDTRHEIVVLAVVERKTAVSRVDNVFLSWMRIVTKLLHFEGSQRRRAWEAWPQTDSSVPKLHADARPIQLYLDARPASSKSVAESSQNLVAAAKANGSVLLAASSTGLPALP